MYKVALDDGHGMQTPGKRTPAFADGSVMHENEFNRRVVQLLAEKLVAKGIDVVEVAPGDNDISISDRVAAANHAKVNLYVSVHANALGGGNWSSGQGVETYHYPGSKESEKLSNIIHAKLAGGTEQKDRGVKSANFYVLRKTAMPAVLVECGFMTNPKEAELLKSESFRIECAEEICAGICEYLGVQPEDPFEKLVQHGIIGDPVYWKANAVSGQKCEGEYVRTILERIASKL